MKQIIECVPNISEGRDEAKIKEIVAAAEAVDGITILDVDPGKSTNRTVITFVGEPQVVIDAAFQLVKKAGELIDMSQHHGEHPRMGATDVCPLVPIANISMEETVEYAKKLAQRIADELDIPTYLYENAASNEQRRNLAYVRQGEYEALPQKLGTEDLGADFGPTEYNDRVKSTGATAVSARDFLVAYNINLNTTSTRRANAIAFDIREAGRVKREGNPITGKIVLDENGEKVRIPGALKAVKGIGWYIDEYGIAQLSLNLTNINITPIHIAFEEAVKSAQSRGIRVTGSELIGLLPKKALLDAGKHFLAKQERSLGVSEDEIIKIAIKTLGLDELTPFNPKERIIEYAIADKAKKLIDMDLVEFANETASESPAPGGGSISAYVGALGISLGTMVANLSAHKRGWDDRWEEFSKWAEQGQALKDEMLRLVDEDTNAFNAIMDAYGLPKGTDAEKQARLDAIQAATKGAILTPYKVMEVALESMKVMKAMADIGNPNSVTDAGVGALCARTAVRGAFMNVKINVGDYNDKDFVKDILEQGKAVEEQALALENEIVDMVEAKI